MRSEEPRQLRLGGELVSYTLCRSARRRSLGLSLDARGVRLAVPARLPLSEAEAFLRQHQDWLRDKLAQQQAHRPPVQALTDGMALALLGEPVRLRLDSVGRRIVWRRTADGREELCLPASDLLKALERALRSRALGWFRGRVEEYCLRLGVPVPPLRLTGARTRWGSCSRRSGIRLHWKLVLLPPALGDYVVAHEVAHLLEMNHSPRFWAVVSTLYPDWPQARAHLREAGRTLPQWAAADEQSPLENE